MFYSHRFEGFAHSFIPYAEVEMYTDSPVNYSSVISNDENVYRISNDSLTGINGRPENVAMLNDYYGLTCWWSVINGNMQEIIDRLESDKKVMEKLWIREL